VKDIRVSLDFTDVPFSALGSSNEKNIPLLKAGESTTLEYSIIAKSDAASEFYTLPVTLSYVDSLANSYNRSNTITLLVGDDPDLVVLSEQDEPIPLGEKTEISLRFINRGPTDIKFLYVTLEDAEGLEVVSSRESYIGKIDSDDYQTEDFTVFIEQGVRSPVELPITLSYSDGMNQEYSEHRTLALTVLSSEEAKKYDGNGDDIIYGIIIIVVIVIVGLVIWRLVRKRRRKK
jgi:hypothetical protein